MAETTIDSLKLEISSSSDGVSKGLDALSASLKKLQRATSKGLGLDAVVTELKSFNSEIKSTSFDGLTKAVDTLSKLGGVKISASIGNQLTAISTALKGADFEGGVSKVQSLVTALKPLESLGKSNLTSYATALKKLPEALNKLDDSTITALTEKIQRLATALKPLGDEMQKVANGFSAFPAKIQRLIKNTNSLASANNKASTSYINLWAKFRMAITAVKTIANKLASAINETNEYIENVNLFTASMGKYTEEARAYADVVSEIMGIDPSEWMRNQGVFMTLATGFGVASDRAYTMSQQLTQLGYDLSSFFNISYEDAMQKLQSGISGELEPLRRLGYDLSQAKLQAVALSLGIDKSISSMTQAEKAQLRYYAIMTQVTTAQGDMARTLNAPANQLRIFSAQVTQLVRAIGSTFIPALNTILPYAIAIARVLRDIVNSIANLLGYELPEVDYSGIETVVGGAEDANNALEDATESAKKLKSAMLGFDELNVISAGNDDGENIDDVLSQFDFELPTYDFLKGAVESRVAKIVKDMKNWLGISEDIDGKISSVADKLRNILETVGNIVGAIAIAKLWKTIKTYWTKFQALKIVDAFLDGFTLINARGGNLLQSFIGGLDNVRYHLTGIEKAIIVAIAGFAEFTVLKNNLRDIMLGAEDVATKITEMGVVTALVATAMYTALGPAGLIATAIIGAIGLLVGFGEAMNEIQQQASNEGFFNGVGTSLDVFKEQLQTSIDQIGIYNEKIIGLADTVDKSRDTINGIKEDINLFTISMGADGEVTAEEVEKLKGYFDELYTNISANMENSSSVITTALVQAMQTATPQIAEQINLLIGEYQRFVRETQGRTAEIKTEIDTAYDSLVGAVPDSAEYKATMDNINKLYEELGYLTGGMSDASWQWGETVKQFDAGKIDFGDDVEDAKTKIGEIADLGKTALDDIAKSRDAVLREIDNSIQYATKYGSLEDVELLGDIRATIEANYNEQESAVKDEIARIFDDIQEGMIAKIPEMQANLEEEWDNFNPFTKWLNGNSKAVWVKDGIKGFKPQFEGIEEALSTHMSELKIDGETWATEAMDSILEKLFGVGWNTNSMGYTTAYITYKTTLDDAIKDTFEELEASGKKVSKATGSEITNGLGEGIESTVDNPVNAIGDVIHKIEKEGNTVAEIHSPSRMFARMGEQISRGLAQGVSDFSYVVLNSLKTVLNTAFSTSVAENYGYTFGRALGNAMANAIGSTEIRFNATSGAFSSYNFPAYASGGFPDSGQLFIAREAGAEMVGSIGRRTAVANNDQIVEGIYQGVLEAMRASNANNGNGSDVDVKVYLDRKQITASVEKRQRERGTTIYTGGVVYGV